MTTKKKADTTNQRIIDSGDYLGPAASSMDCTGLIPSGTISQADLESYEALYPYCPPQMPDEEADP